MKRLFFCFFLFISLIQFNNCSTILSVSRGDLSVYGGVISSYSSLGVHHPHNPFSGITNILFILDLPFSLVLDTIILPVTGPVTLYHYMVNRKYVKNQPLFDAVADGDKETITSLLSQGYDVNASENSDGVTLFMRAATKGNVEILQLLIDNRADIKAKTIDNKNALNFSLYSETEDAYKFLSKMDIPITDKEVIFEAAMLGKEYALLDLLKKIPNAIKEKESQSEKNLAMLAIENSISESTILNLLKQVDTTATDYEGNEPIHYAAKFGKLKVLEFLVSKNRPIDPLNKNNETPFLLAVQNDQLGAVKYLVDKKVNLNSEWNKDALSYAISHEKDDLFNFLISKNFKISNPSILFTAMMTDKKRIVSVLLTKIPNAHKLKDGDKELIYHAAMYNNLEALRLCISNNVPVDLKDKDTGETPLILAWNYGSFEAFEFLLKSNANVNQTLGQDGNTFLHDYATNPDSRDEKFLDTLLKYGINKKIKNGLNQTAYDIIAENNDFPENILSKLKP